MEGITHKVGQTTLASVAYTRDGIGSPTQADWVNGTAWTRTYGYDAMNRLTRETHIVSQQTQWENTWDYDWVGNRLDTGFVYDEDTDWLSEGPQDVERLYTGAGSMYDKDGTGYTYNAQELLSGVGSTTMAWDAESRRVSLTVGNDVYTFVYDPTASIPAVVQEFGPDDRNIVYVREPKGSLIARVDLDQSKVYFHYFDALGSTVLVANNLGQVTDRYDYDAWGEVDHLSGSMADNPYLYVGELGYYDHWQAPALADMLHLGVRFYEPEVGRFGQRDPALMDLCMYSYASGSPVHFVDPDGWAPRGVGDIAKAWKECITKAWEKNCDPNKVSRKTLRCVIYCESRDNEKAVNKSSGAAGLMQIIPEWWDCVKGGKPYRNHKKWKNRCQDKTSSGEKFDVFNACDNIECGVWLFCDVHKGDPKDYGTTRPKEGQKCMEDCMRTYTW